MQIKNPKTRDGSGVRTHASGEIAALTQRLGPLGHPTLTPVGRRRILKLSMMKNYLMTQFLFHAKVFLIRFSQELHL
jgi:hypothetical protein